MGEGEGALAAVVKVAPPRRDSVTIFLRGKTGVEERQAVASTPLVPFDQQNTIPACPWLRRSPPEGKRKTAEDSTRRLARRAHSRGDPSRGVPRRPLPAHGEGRTDLHVPELGKLRRL